jgi:PBSX family phage terminase large subunit
LTISQTPTQINFTDLVAPSFYGVHRDFRRGGHTHYWLKGGRGSTKSSFAALEILIGVMGDPLANATVLRKVGDSLRDSAYEQYLWAIDKLGVAPLWQDTKSPMRLTYRPTGQRIVFKGADKPRKLKSSTFRVGYNRFIHYEEIDEFGNMDDIRSINQSLMRGGDSIQALYTFNPPRSPASWILAEVEQQRLLRDDTLVHHSTYKDVPEGWLGENFLRDAAHLAAVNPQRYAHEYLGEPVGTGAEVFTNVTQRPIPDAEIKAFDKVYRGLDFGYAADPLHYTEVYHDSARRRLYIFSEIHQAGLDNAAAVKKILAFAAPGGGVITADSAEPRTINEFRQLGLGRIQGAKKGRGSVEHGVKWLQDLEEIVIDPARCPNTAREFVEYELDFDSHGNLRGDYPDRNNHSIDAVRYALETVLKPGRWLV